MNLRTIKSNVARWLRPTEKDKAEITHQISERLRYNRQLLKRSGTVWDDEEQAQKIALSRRRRLKFWLNQRLISAEKRRVEPTAKWVYGADLFKIIERLSPTLEALGVIAIPLVLFFATQRYQDGLEQRELEKLQQETVANYLNQLSTILLDLEGDLRDPQNQELRTLANATTLTLLRDPNLDGLRKGQVIEFLSQMNMVQGGLGYDLKNLWSEVDVNDPVLRLDNADLSNANLAFINLRYALLRGANLSNANLLAIKLRGADLGTLDVLPSSKSSQRYIPFRLDSFQVRTNLNGANLNSADLMDANLRGADLRGADLSSAELQDANLRGADLRGADLKNASMEHASLQRADLRGVRNLTWRQLKGANLCETQLPDYQLPDYTSKLDPNKDC
ncbi:pentapeptide repeat-containing protein [Adonisia turfae]